MNPNDTLSTKDVNTADIATPVAASGERGGRLSRWFALIGTTLVIGLAFLASLEVLTRLSIGAPRTSVKPARPKSTASTSITGVTRT